MGLQPFGGRSGERRECGERGDELKGENEGRGEVGEEEEAVLKDGG